MLNKQLQNKQLINRQSIFKWLCLLVLLSLAMHPFAFARSASDISLSPKLQAELLSKILLHERGYRRQQGIKILVLGEQAVALAFKQLVGKKADHIDIASVKMSTALPMQKYDVLYFNDEKYLAEAVAYANKFGIVTITGTPRLVERGATLGTGTEKGRPHFYLNLRTSFATDLEWDQKVLNIVKVYR